MIEKLFGKFYKLFVLMVLISWILGLCLNFKIIFLIFGLFLYFSCFFGDVFNR